jgi:hypothetical protein
MRMQRSRGQLPQVCANKDGADWFDLQVKLTLMLERANQSFGGAGAKDMALNDLLNRLCSARKRDRVHRIMHWSQDYPSLAPAKGQVVIPPGNRPLALCQPLKYCVSLLIKL